MVDKRNSAEKARRTDIGAGRIDASHIRPFRRPDGRCEPEAVYDDGAFVTIGGSGRSVAKAMAGLIEATIAASATLRCPMSETWTP